ncbi:MAG TPA: DUF2079 domain-containing protein [Oscillatoriales cyanobacterium M59_W2019_021]|nr:DUF2079 domain-containing protein [Oscillatoriales cyanobacterium M4454_W2019_049]HIK51971.1 DUF2079 domain-containing protein [Oscillatoriales cyanobacterium M59_W2019_021]
MAIDGSKNPWFRLMLAGAIAFFGFCLILVVHRYYTFYASYDQGIFNQVFWNNAHGRFFQSSLSSSLSTNVIHAGEVPEVFYHRLGQHFTPALLLWLPIYALFPSPLTLSVLQVVLVTAAGIVLYFLARQHVESPVAAFMTLSFYAANAILGPTLGNFHDICQIPLFVFSLLLAMEKRWWWLFWLLVPVILLVREDAGIGLFGIGVYLVLSRRYPRTGLALCTLSFGYMVLLTTAIMPLFSEDISKRFMLERFGQYAPGKEEASSVDIIWGILSNPFRLVGELVTPVDRTLLYLLGQWLPLAFVPAISPAAWAIAGFPLFKLFIGKGETVLSINIRYAMTVVPGLFYGAILWWSAHSFRFKKVAFRRFWVGCMVLSVMITLVSNPNRTLSFVIPDSFQPRVFVPLTSQWKHASQLYPLLAQIPPDASVTATTYLIPHLSSRRELLRLPMLELRDDSGQVVRVDYAIADLWQLRQYLPAFKVDRELFQTIVPQISNLIGTGEYGVLDFRDGAVLLQRGIASNADALAAWQAFVEETAPLLSHKS